MEDSQYQILTYLGQGPDTSQRQIALGTGVSVGMVNVLLKKMVKKGLVKLERVNGKTLRYILTPQGMTEKTKLAYQFMKASYHRIVKLHQALEEIVRERSHNGPVNIVFYGPNDEILEILQMAARDLKLQYIGAQIPEELSDVDLKGNYLVITWKTETKEILLLDAPAVNILEKV